MSQPATSREWVLEGHRRLVDQRRALGALGADDVRVRFVYCGLCGSDLSKFEASTPVAYPMSLGHEFVAEVVAVGERVERLRPGDIVTSDLNHRCGRCDQCLARRSHLCREAGARLFTNRGFAELGDLHVDYLLRVDGPPAAHLTLVEPLSCVLHAKDWAAPTAADRVLILGAGGLGLCLAFAFSQVQRQIPVEVTDPLATRLSLLDKAAAPRVRTVSVAEGEYDVVFDLSGTEDGLRVATDSVRAGGTLCMMSHLMAEPSGGFLLKALTRRDVTFKVSYLNGERANLERAARMLADGWDVAWQGALELVAIDDLQAAFERRRASPACKTVIQIAR
jgi:threonine dehydrogenase-like Zn-dependent dehydrogenase